MSTVVKRDGDGGFVVLNSKPPSPPDASIDNTLKDGLMVIRRLMDRIIGATAHGWPDREVVTALKDCMTMLLQLRRAEQELLEDMSDEEIKAALIKLK